MSQVLIHQRLTMDARVSPCGNCGGQSGTETGLSTSSLVSLCQYYSIIPQGLHTHHVSYGG
jgi:hypothetical protein